MIGSSKKKRESSDPNSSEDVAVNGYQNTGLENEHDILDSGSEMMVSTSQRNLFRNLLIDYFKGVEKHLLKEHQVCLI